MSVTVNKSANVSYSSQLMYKLVIEAEHYPEFLPWCTKTIVYNRTDDSMHAKIFIAKTSLGFTTACKMDPHKAVDINMTDGPFEYLHANWQFVDVSDNSCQVRFFMQFDYANFILKSTLGPVFNIASTMMVDAFIKRAKQLYG